MMTSSTQLIILQEISFSKLKQKKALTCPGLLMFHSVCSMTCGDIVLVALRAFDMATKASFGNNLRFIRNFNTGVSLINQGAVVGTVA